MRFYLRTLGELSLHPESPDSPPVLSESKSLIIVALLAVTPDHTLSRDHLADLLWPGTEHSKAKRLLRQNLYYLSTHAGPTLIETENAHISLVEDAFDCDLWEFDRAVQDGDREKVVDDLTGRFLESFERKLGRELGEWVDLQNQRIRSARRKAFQRLIRRNLECGREEIAIRYARDYATASPLDEEAQLYLVRALKQVGDEAGAFHAYEDYRTLVRSAVDDEPSPELEEAAENLRQVLLADREWKPIAAPEPETNGSGKAGVAAGWLVTLGVIAGVAAMSLGRAIGGASTAPNQSLDALDARVLVVTRDPDDPTGTLPRELVLSGNSARLEASDAPWFGSGPPMVAPDGRYTAYHVSGPGEDGMDLYLARGNEEPQPLFDGQSDQLALDWSPDGQKMALLLANEDEATQVYTARLLVYDVDTGTFGPPIATWVNAPEPNLRWSPDGRWLALSEDGGGDQDLVLRSVDGADVRVLAATAANERSMAWSPDSRRVAYISTESGRARVWIRELAADSAVRLLDGPGVEETPVWISNRILGFVREIGGELDFWARDLVTGEMRRLTDCGCVTSLYERAVRATSLGPWISTVGFDLPTLAVPGDTLEPRVHVSWSDGARRIGPALRWTSSDSSVARPLEGDRIAVEAPGTATLVASAGGWRADTLMLTAAELHPTGLAPAYEESWKGGLGEDWMPGGDPFPFTRTEGGQDGGGVFVNNGDRHYESGALSSRWFQTKEGVTVDVWGRIPDPAVIHRYLTIALGTWPGPPPDPRPLDDALLTLRAGMNGRDVNLVSSGVTITTPSPRPIDAWHRYTVQVHPDGTVDLLTDGRLIRRAHGLLDPATIGDSLRVGLGGKSVGTEVQHGLLRVYEGLEYDFPGAGNPNR